MSIFISQCKKITIVVIVFLIVAVIVVIAIVVAITIIIIILARSHMTPSMHLSHMLHQPNNIWSWLTAAEATHELIA